MRSGVRLGVDVGKARIGLAQSDPSGLLATPLETVARVWNDAVELPSADLNRLLQLEAELDPIEWLVGLPIALSGNETASTADARAFATALAKVASSPVRLVDERLSTVSAHAQLRSSGRKTKQHRSVIDQVAAVILLQSALDSERGGVLPGVLLDVPKSARGEL